MTDIIETNNICSICGGTTTQINQTPYIIVVNQNNTKKSTIVTHCNNMCPFDININIDGIRVNYVTNDCNGIFLARRCKKNNSHIFFEKHAIEPPQELIDALTGICNQRYFFAHNYKKCPIKKNKLRHKKNK
jgi:hypothetical protein